MSFPSSSQVKCPLNLCVRPSQDRALPISGRSSSVGTRLRLCNKLTELMLRLKFYEEALEFAQTALDISVSLGMETPQTTLVQLPHSD